MGLWVLKGAWRCDEDDSYGYGYLCGFWGAACGRSPVCFEWCGAVSTRAALRVAGMADCEIIDVYEVVEVFMKNVSVGKAGKGGKLLRVCWLSA